MTVHIAIYWNEWLLIRTVDTIRYCCVCVRFSTVVLIAINWKNCFVKRSSGTRGPGNRPEIQLITHCFQLIDVAVHILKTQSESFPLNLYIVGQKPVSFTRHQCICYFHTVWSSFSANLFGGHEKCCNPNRILHIRQTRLYLRDKLESTGTA